MADIAHELDHSSGQLDAVSGELRQAVMRLRMVPVIILTSSKHDEDLLASYLNGANSYVCKPVDMLQFVEAVRQLGLYWLVLNQRPPQGVAR